MTIGVSTCLKPLTAVAVSVALEISPAADAAFPSLLAAPNVPKYGIAIAKFIRARSFFPCKNLPAALPISQPLDINSPTTPAGAAGVNVAAVDASPKPAEPSSDLFIKS